jgi:hypothetical protein
VAGSARNLLNWDVVAAEARQIVRGFTLRHLFAKTELAKAVASPTEDFCEFFGGNMVVIFKFNLMHGWLTLLA